MNKNRPINIYESLHTHFIILVSLFMLAGCTNKVVNQQEQVTKSDSVAFDKTNATHLISVDDTYLIWYKTSPAQIPLNQNFEIQMFVTSKDGQPIDKNVQVNVDARMPQHRHGMLSQPDVIRIAAGLYQVKGMLWHMPGRWELYFDISQGGVIERARSVVILD